VNRWISRLPDFDAVVYVQLHTVFRQVFVLGHTAPLAFVPVAVADHITLPLTPPWPIVLVFNRSAFLVDRIRPRLILTYPVAETVLAAKPGRIDAVAVDVKLVAAHFTRHILRVGVVVIALVGTVPLCICFGSFRLEVFSAIRAFNFHLPTPCREAVFGAVFAETLPRAERPRPRRPGLEFVAAPITYFGRD